MGKKGREYKRNATIVRLIHEKEKDKWNVPRSWALVRFDGKDERIYVKPLHKVELIRAPTRVRNGRAA